MVTLTGAGGVGKTQTALHVATALNESGDGATCFVALAPLDNPVLVAAAIASTLRVQEVPNRPLLETLIAYFKNKALLLILDNCEHVIDAGRDRCRCALERLPPPSDPGHKPRIAAGCGRTQLPSAYTQHPIARGNR